MSHKVAVNFEAIAIKAEISCCDATKALSKIDEVSQYVEKNASSLTTKALEDYRKFLLESKNEIENRSKSLINNLEMFKKHRIKYMDMDTNYAHTEENLSAVEKFRTLNSLVDNDLKQLRDDINELTGEKLEVIMEMVKSNLFKAINEREHNLNIQAQGGLIFDSNLLEKINAIEDVSLKSIAHSILVSGETNFDNIIKLAKEKYLEILNQSHYKETVIENLKKNGVEKEKIEEITSKEITYDTRNQLVKEANEAITDENIRKEALKVIIKSIRERGFIVDTKNNLRIDRERNVVKLAAKKPDGRKADFEIALNGKFMYHFDGYEGQACMKDITPFMEDLQNIYGLDILHEEDIWSNPDKIQTKKYQYVNTNKNHN